MSYLLIVSFIVVLITTVILFKNLVVFDGLGEPNPDLTHTPSVAVCIPARNEERVIERCIRSLLQQDYPDLNIFVLDDGSSDATLNILDNLRAGEPGKLKVFMGKPKPSDWQGKTWACHQLGKMVKAEIIIFADADTWFEPQAVSRAVSIFNDQHIDCITVWPEQELKTFWEKMLIPIVYYVLVAYLPFRYVHKTPAWIPDSLKKRTIPLFAAACGQFIAFKREAYESIGGHESVKAEIVEDVALARQIKQNGLSLNMYHGLDTIHCRMYENEKEIREGFRKNFLAGFGSQVTLFIGAGLLHFLVHIYPFFMLYYGYKNQMEFITGLSAMIVSLLLFHRLILALWFRWDTGYALLHPVSILWYQFLAFIVIMDRVSGRPAKWKGRHI